MESKTMDTELTSRSEPPDAGSPSRNPVRRLYDWVIGWSVHPSAMTALFVLAFVEAVFFPVPPDVLLIAMVLGARSRWALFALVTSVGSVLGGIAGYYLGYAASGLAMRIVELYGQTALKDELAQLFAEHSFAAIWFAGLTPIPYKIFTITAGLCHDSIDLTTLVAASAASRPLRFFAVAYLLRLFGPAAKQFIDRYFNLLTLLVAVGIVVGFLVLPHLTGR
jgi:membrane protein YqaA with SNARE-associated domain